jgi:hypothetical protein
VTHFTCDICGKHFDADDKHYISSPGEYQLVFDISPNITAYVDMVRVDSSCPDDEGFSVNTPDVCVSCFCSALAKVKEEEK